MSKNLTGSDLSHLRIQDLVPHAAPILMLEEIRAYNDESVSVTALLKSDSAFADAHGRISNCLAIEMMAQAAAVYAGIHSQREEQAIKTGLLISVKQLSLHTAFLSSDTLYTVHATQYHAHGSLAVFDCTLAAEATLASAQLHFVQLADR